MTTKIIECPRDAMQGMEPFIPTAKKAAYINQLLKVGFDTIDFGSFVSPKAIPQLKDTADVLKQLDLSGSKSKLLAIVANERGAVDALNFEEIDYLGYPFSISETFQKRNTNASIEDSLNRVEVIQKHCVRARRTLVIYISMAFGNPYGDPWSGDLAAKWTEKLHQDLGIEVIALSDTVGVSDEQNIAELFETIIPSFPALEVGAHLHTTPEQAVAKVDAAYQAGCRRFDAALKGYGGCPMAEDELVGNLATEQLIRALEKREESKIDATEFISAMTLANNTFPI